MLHSDDEHALWIAGRRQLAAAKYMKWYFYWLEVNPTVAMRYHHLAQVYYRIAREHLGIE